MPQSSPDNPLYQWFLDRPADAPQIHKWHHYFDVYHAAFAAWRGKPMTMLEIGVFRGGSLRMWQDYFGPQARIFGMDIDPACTAHALPGGKVFIGDQADPAFLHRVLEETGPPDIVLDDGGHTMKQMITSLEVIYPRMKVPGVYVIEDTHTAFWHGKRDLLSRLKSLLKPRGGFLDDPRGRSIYEVALEICRGLQGWTGRQGDFGRLGRPPGERPAGAPVSETCRTTDSVSFHDSMIVFRRAVREEPFHEIR
jgi:hypothetical protein